MILQRREIQRSKGREEAIDHALEEIERTKDYAIQMRGKLIRPTVDAHALAKIEERMDRFTKYPSKMLTSEQTHGVTGVPIIGNVTAPETLPPLPDSVLSSPGRTAGAGRGAKTPVRPRQRDDGPAGWESGGME